MTATSSFSERWITRKFNWESKNILICWNYVSIPCCIYGSYICICISAVFMSTVYSLYIYMTYTIFTSNWVSNWVGTTISIHSCHKQIRSNTTIWPRSLNPLTLHLLFFVFFFLGVKPPFPAKNSRHWGVEKNQGGMTKIVSGPGRCRSVPVLEMDDASGSDEERGQLKGIGSREVLLDQQETPVHEPSCGCWILHEQWNKTGVVEWQKFYFTVVATISIVLEDTPKHHTLTIWLID